MNQRNSENIYFLEQHEQEITNCCKKRMINNEVRNYLKQNMIKMLQIITYRKFKQPILK